MTSTGYSFGALHHSGPPYTAPHQDASSAPPQLYVLQQHTLPACPGIPLTINSERHFEVTLKAYAQGKMGPDDAIIGTRVLKCNTFTVAYLVCLCRFFYMNTDDFFCFSLFLFLVAATLDPVTNVYHASNCDRGTAKGTQCKPCQAVRRTLNARSKEEVWMGSRTRPGHRCQSLRNG